MFNPIQIILLILACHVIGTLGQNVQLVAKFGGQQVFRGLIAGFIMGDVKTGLLIGGTFQLMSMGLAAYGGASIPNFNTALWISVPFAIASGTDAPLELAMAVGGPVATLGIQLDVIAKTVNSYWYHRAEKHVEKREYKKLYRDILIGEYGFGRAALGQTLPVITAMGVLDCDGNWYKNGDETPYDELLNEYNILEYNNAFGGNGKSMETFTLNIGFG